MKIETLEIAGIGPAMFAMRNPLDSWKKSDTVGMGVTINDGETTYTCRTIDRPWSVAVNAPENFNAECCTSMYEGFIGNNDLNLSMRLEAAGAEHCKHLRMAMVWANIEAPRFWEIELDTYRFGVEKVSCSTMHRLMSRPLTISDFEFDGNDVAKSVLEHTILELNDQIAHYKTISDCDSDNKKNVWRGIIQNLPQSYIQKRTYMFSYAALRNIVRQRANHKLSEWHSFIDWAHTLPYAEELIFYDGDNTAEVGQH